MSSEYEELNRIVIELTGSPADANYWWTEPHKAFGGETPKDVFLKNPEAVIVYLNNLVFGQW